MAATGGYQTYASYQITGGQILAGWGAVAGVSLAQVTGLQIDAPEAEVVDMTTVSDALGYRRLATTGVVTNGLITIDFLYDTAEQFEVSLLAATRGELTIVTNYAGARAISYQVICKAANLESRVGDAVRFQAQFVPMQASQQI